MSRKRYVAMLGAVLALALVSAACSSNDDNGGGGTTGGGATGASGASGAGGAASGTITVKDFAFNPSTVDVPSGESTIEITNTDAVQHSFTLDDGSVSQIVAPGTTETVTVKVTADAGFHCQFHPTQMTGTLKVG
jgi:plastocyanin